MSADKASLPKAGADYSSLLTVFAAATLFMWCVTWWTGYKLGYQRALDIPFAVFSIGEKTFYTPWAISAWQYKFSAHPAAGEILKTAWLVFLGGFGVIMIGLTIVLGIIKRRLGAIKTHNAFSSDWADDIDVEFSGLLARDQWATQKELAQLAASA